MIAGTHLKTRAQRRIGQDNVSLLRGQFRSQVHKCPCVADQAHWCRKLQRRLRQAIYKDFRYDSGETDHDASWGLRRLPAQCAHQITSQGEELARVTLDDLPALGEQQGAASLSEELLSERFFEDLDLRPDGGLGEA